MSAKINEFIDNFNSILNCNNFNNSEIKAKENENVENQKQMEEKENIDTNQNSLQCLVEKIKNNQFKNIIVMVGAGISVSCGIPDFRTKGTGLYDNLQKYNLTKPEDIFEINFFRNNPKPFNILAKELFPSTNSSIKPSPTHYFIKLLYEKNLLLRCFTQNIDGLEYIAGIPDEKIVQAHVVGKANPIVNLLYTVDLMVLIV